MERGGGGGDSLKIRDHGEDGDSNKKKDKQHTRNSE